MKLIKPSQVKFFIASMLLIIAALAPPASTTSIQAQDCESGSGLDVNAVLGGGFEPQTGHAGCPVEAEVFDPDNPCMLAQCVFKVYFDHPDPPTFGGSKWFVARNTVDMIDANKAEFFESHSGFNLVDLAGTPDKGESGLGLLRQNLETVAGRSYILEFFVSSNQVNNILAVPPQDLDATADRKFDLFWGDEPILNDTLTPVMNTFDRFTFILEAADNVTPLEFCAVMSPYTVSSGGLWFGPTLDDVSAILIQSRNDVIKLSENEDDFRFDVCALENDSGIDRVIGAFITNCSDNIPDEMCGIVLQNGFPGGEITWQTSDGEPLAFDFLSEGEIGTIRIRYTTETERNVGRNGESGPMIVNDQSVWRIEVTGINDAPIAVDDCDDVVLNGIVNIPILENDSDVDGQIKLPIITTEPINGDVDVNEDGTISYSPDPGFSGNDFFEYTICDELGASSGPARVEVRVWLGDVNGDGRVDLLDVAPFVSQISTGTFTVEADINRDGFVNLLDVGPFVNLLTSGPCDTD